MDSSFQDFEIGDLVLFDKTFSNEDWKMFDKISGDKNPLHSPSKFSAESEFGEPIVPLHLLLMPLSKIAGMHLPGLPSLYLGHETESKKPAFYGEELTYSSKITAINKQHKVLTLKTLILRGVDVLVETSMNVQCRFEQWTTKKKPQIIKRPKAKRLIIVGSSGEIGKAIAKVFADSGWSLCLHARDKKHQSISKSELIQQSGVEYFQADLSDTRDIQRLSDYIKNTEWLDGLIFAASPKIDSSIENLIKVNFTSLTLIVNSAITQMLAQQTGTVIYIGSSAVLNNPDNMVSYTASKVLGTHWMNQLDDKVRQFDVRCKVLAPNFVSSNFSVQYRTDLEALLPYEVAECAFKMLAPDGSAVVVKNVNREIHGTFGFSPISNTDESTVAESSPNIEKSGGATQNVAVIDVVSKIISGVLNLDLNEEVRHGGLGITNGWDSLAQIKIILALEKQFGITFESVDLAEISDYKTIVAKCQSYVEGNHTKLAD